MNKIGDEDSIVINAVVFLIFVIIVVGLVIAIPIYAQNKKVPDSYEVKCSKWGGEVVNIYKGSICLKKGTFLERE